MYRILNVIVYKTYFNIRRYICQKLMWLIADISKVAVDNLKSLLLQLYLVQYKLIFSAARAEFCDHSTDDPLETCRIENSEYNAWGF